MGLDPAFAKSIVSALAAAWIAVVAVGSPGPERPGRWFWQRLTPRLAILGAVAVAMLFAAVAAWENGGLPDLEDHDRDPDGSWARLATPARTLAMGAAVLVIAAAIAGLGSWIGSRSRTAARGAVLFVVLLLAGAVWPLFSIPAWCAHLAAADEVPVASPLAFYRPDCDPSGWVAGWLTAIRPFSVAGMVLAVVVGVSAVAVFGRATARRDLSGCEAACAALACCGVVLLGLGVLEIHKRATWVTYGILHDGPYGSCSSDWIPICTRVKELEFADWNGSTEAWVRRWYEVPCSCPAPARGLPPGFIALAAGAGLFGVVFGEFHLRGRRLLRDPATGEVVPAAP